ncbi:HNH endonuclease [Gimesia panareensis]|uniref:HNH endonuclease n=1 Tax=Gimesia panareensis TaxID=2527978 RepID=A0A517Q7P0_9PLAN|nr:HNH endonuclease [Gimesia panareensis]QDT27654.1 HNH endonuclease [Gimesia panareensis]
MRPVRRNSSPISGDYSDYKKAKTDLISRIGSGWCHDIHLASYCNYCERPISTLLAVEHIEPKDGPHGRPHLIGRWDNFLVACPNCNSTKKDKLVNFKDLYFPDRDNTFHAFRYLADGNIEPMNAGDQIAEDTLRLTGLDKAMRQTQDVAGRLIAEERASQRMEIWKLAELGLKDFHSDPTNNVVKDSIVNNAVLSGFFSVWMTVFCDVPEMMNRFIDAFSGTRESECFDFQAAAISPAPNPDNLRAGGKI